MSFPTPRVFPLIAIMVVGCGSPHSAELQCPARVLPAFKISAVDALTSQPVNGYTLVSSVGSRVDTLHTAGSDASGPLGVSGVFQITVEKQGYVTWEAAGVEVEQGDCGPETLFLTARLDKS